MDPMYIISGIVLLVVCILVIWWLSVIIWSLFDHTGWKPNSTPDRNAKISNVKRTRVEYTKNGMKYKTTIEFSDGFYFITHKTNREDGFFTYQISIDESLQQQIIDKAILKHNKYVKKKNQQFGGHSEQVGSWWAK